MCFLNVLNVSRIILPTPPGGHRHRHTSVRRRQGLSVARHDERTRLDPTASMQVSVDEMWMMDDVDDGWCDVGAGNFWDLFLRFCFSGWWFQPNWKICSSSGIISPNGGENKQYLKTPPRNDLGWFCSWLWTEWLVGKKNTLCLGVLCGGHGGVWFAVHRLLDYCLRSTADTVWSWLEVVLLPQGFHPSAISTSLLWHMHYSDPFTLTHENTTTTWWL